MIIGSGMLARGFSPYFGSRLDSCVYAAGVSNSTCDDEREFDCEEDRLRAALEQYASADLFVYFGTCSANGLAARTSRYVKHKLTMEGIVTAHSRFLILRLPQVAGHSENPHTLLNYTFNRVSRSERFQIWASARRSIIDVDDAARIAARLASDGVHRERIDVANPSDTAILDIVHVMAQVVGKPPIYDVLQGGEAHPTNTERMRNVAERCGVVFDNGYLERVIRKYYGGRVSAVRPNSLT